jgi:hypothetical protein
VIVESLALVVTFRVTVSLEKEVELFDGCGCLVAFAVVVPEVEDLGRSSSLAWVMTEMLRLSELMVSYDSLALC